MDAITVNQFWRAMEVIRSNEMLEKIQANDAPWLKKQDRSKLIKSLSQKAKPKLEDVKAKAVSTLEAAQHLVRQLSNGR